MRRRGGTRRHSRKRGSRRGSRRGTTRIQRSMHPRLDLAKFIVRNVQGKVSSGGGGFGSYVTLQNMYQAGTGGSGTSLTSGPDTIYYFAFSLSDVQQYLTVYGNLWDQCKIAGVQFKAIPRMTESTTTVGNQSLTENWAILGKDYDGQLPVSSINDIQNATGSKRITMTNRRSIKTFIKPKCLLQMTDLASNTLNSITPARWVYNFSSGNTLQHYGIWVAIPGCSPVFNNTGGSTAIGSTGLSSPGQVWDLVCTYYIAFRSRTQ